MEHEHDPTVELGGSIRCRTCGIELPYIEETIALPDSSVRANRILQEIAVAGSYLAGSFKDNFVVYYRDNAHNHEELTAQKLNPRRYRVYKRTMRRDD